MAIEAILFGKRQNRLYNRDGKGFPEESGSFLTGIELSAVVGREKLVRVVQIKPFGKGLHITHGPSGGEDKYIPCGGKTVQHVFGGRRDDFLLCGKGPVKITEENAGILVHVKAGVLHLREASGGDTKMSVAGTHFQPRLVGTVKVRTAGQKKIIASSKRADVLRHLGGVTAVVGFDAKKPLCL